MDVLYVHATLGHPFSCHQAHGVLKGFCARVYSAAHQLVVVCIHVATSRNGQTGNTLPCDICSYDSDRRQLCISLTLPLSLPLLGRLRAMPNINIDASAMARIPWPTCRSVLTVPDLVTNFANTLEDTTRAVTTPLTRHAMLGRLRCVTIRLTWRSSTPPGKLI